MPGTRILTEPRSPWIAVASFLGRCLLYTVPFGLFFGVLLGAGWVAVPVSLVFVVVILLAIKANETWVVPRIRGERPPEQPLAGAALLRHAASYAVASAIGALAAGIIIHYTLIPGFLGSARAWRVWLAFTLLLTSLFMSLAYARAFYRSNLQRARNEERMKAEIARAELRALRAQINPHFLFNTLNAIASLISVDPGRAEAMTEQLAEIFRYALRASEQERAPLAEELAFVRSYLEIQRARMGDRLRVEEHIDDDALACLVPSLLLQPLVENAVQHAVEPRTEGGTVRLAATAKDGVLTLEVEDDGPGLGPEALESGRFGLFSVRERLRVLGPGHELVLESPTGGGARVRVRIPAARAAERKP
jgi:signal transduction histidine kinase